MNIKINLLPKDLRYGGNTGIPRKVAYIVSVIILVVYLGTALDLTAEVFSLKKEVNLLMEETEPAAALVECYTRSKEYKNQLQEQLANINQNAFSSFSWSHLLLSLQQRVPQGVYLTEINGQGKQRIQIFGKSLSFGEIGQLARAFGDIPAVKEIILVKADLTQDDSQVLYSFQIDCTL